ncbi:hypothetical protein [Burkholderia cepacia]|nr:hypothetical protein [Burkholderia cepacia]
MNPSPSAPVSVPDALPAARSPAPWRRWLHSPVTTRLATGALVLWAAVTLSFAAVHLAPGDIVGILIGEQLSTPEIEAAIRREWGLDEPLPLQYVHYLWRVLHG